MAAGSNRKSKLETERADTKLLWQATFVCVIYDTVRGYISTIKHLMGRGALSLRGSVVHRATFLKFFDKIMDDYDETSSSSHDVSDC